MWRGTKQRVLGRRRARIRPSRPPCASAVVVAAGSSSRMGGKVNKPYLTLRGRAVLSWTLSALARVRGLREIVLVTRPEERTRARRAVVKARLPRSLSVRFADGGARRQDSVLNGVRAASTEAGLILIHDAARPFPPAAAIAAAQAAALACGAAILAVPVRDTVKKQFKIQNSKFKIQATVPRAGLWLAQTPQVFRRELILELLERLARETPGVEVTDDAAVCERYGQAVALVESNATNFKITRPEDLKIAEALLRMRIVK